MEYSPAQPARKDEGDDTKEIVNPKAQPYLEDAGKVTMSRLVLVKDGAETSFPLVRDTYTLGRHRNNDIVISDPKVSSFHARIDRSPEGFVLVDLKSRNGCWRQRQAGRDARCLKTGDEVRVGTARLVYAVDYTATGLRSGIRSSHRAPGGLSRCLRSTRSPECSTEFPKPTSPKVLAPPYDVIPPAYQDELYARDPRNIVRVVLNREPGDAAYDDAGATYARLARRGRAGHGPGAGALPAGADLRGRGAARSGDSASWRASAPRTRRRG